MQGGDLGTFQHWAAVVFCCVEFCLIVSCVEFYDFSIYNILYNTVACQHKSLLPEQTNNMMIFQEDRRWRRLRRLQGRFWDAQRSTILHTDPHKEIKADPHVSTDLILMLQINENIQSLPFPSLHWLGMINVSLHAFIVLVPEYFSDRFQCLWFLFVINDEFPLLDEERNSNFCQSWSTLISEQKSDKSIKYFI